ncbi:MAG: translation initiation factor IF-2 [Firmicutes bacterium]|nr:translation initiation factor IF-2 [Bacillota bacterium]
MQHQDKERNKFAKLENGGNTGKKNKQKIQERSLEKQAKPKKHNKPKAVVQEEEDIMEDLPTGTIAVTVPITVAGLCEQAGISTSQVIMALMKMGIMANINQNIDEDTVLILADELKLNVVVAKVEEEVEEEGLETFEDAEEDLKPRAPIITVMGHVDHGKTSLLDAIRSTNVTVSEAGGITQHIGASEVVINGQKIVFLDTPGHEAFTAMRARGAHITDIAVLVVAADDSVKPQTIESISHAKAAGVPIIVAINKCDKPGANPERVKQDLTEHGILVEDWGGDTICVPVSAKTGDGIVNLLEMILLQAEMLELKANPNRLALGSVIEARLDKNKGPVATLLVTNGTLKSGMSVVAGTSSGRIRLMTDFKGNTIRKAGPATAVEILGLTEVPEAGDQFNAVKDDKLAREIAENRKTKLREEVLARNASTTLEQLFSQIQEGEVKDLNLIIKGDVTGSIGAIVSSLEKLSNENVRVKIVHTGVGTVNESDVTLAGTTGSIIIGFNVRPTTAVQALAERENIQIRLYRVIYDIINDVEDAMKGMLDPEYVEEVLGKVEVRDTFKVPNVGVVAGSYVTEGKVVRNAEIRLVRDGIVIHEGKISSLKRYKDDAKEVNQGYECGLGIENYNDVKIGDIIECFHMVEVERK